MPALPANAHSGSRISTAQFYWRLKKSFLLLIEAVGAHPRTNVNVLKLSARFNALAFYVYAADILKAVRQLYEKILKKWVDV